MHFCRQSDQRARHTKPEIDDRATTSTQWISPAPIPTPPTPSRQIAALKSLPRPDMHPEMHSLSRYSFKRTALIDQFGWFADRGRRVINKNFINGERRLLRIICSRIITATNGTLLVFTLNIGWSFGRLHFNVLFYWSTLEHLRNAKIAHVTRLPYYEHKCREMVKYWQLLKGNWNSTDLRFHFGNYFRNITSVST